MMPGKVGRARSSSVGGRAIRWLFVSRSTGRITVAQWPNVPLWLFFVFSAVSRILHPSGGAATLLRVAVVAALVVWALDEVVRGVNPFRRLLGLAVLVATVANVALH
jgi:hypothetical protein